MCPSARFQGKTTHLHSRKQLSWKRSSHFCLLYKITEVTTERRVQRLCSAKQSVERLTESLAEQFDLANQIAPWTWSPRDALQIGCCLSEWWSVTFQDVVLIFQIPAKAAWANRKWPHTGKDKNGGESSSVYTRPQIVEDRSWARLWRGHTAPGLTSACSPICHWRGEIENKKPLIFFTPCWGRITPTGESQRFSAPRATETSQYQVVTSAVSTKKVKQTFLWEQPSPNHSDFLARLAETRR